MKVKTLSTILLTVIITAALFSAPAIAATITDTTLTNVNVYANTNIYSIAPDGYYDNTTTATDITNIANRYIYTAGLTANPNPANVNDEVSFTVIGQQGASVYTDDIGTKTGTTYIYGDSNSGYTPFHTYLSGGSFQTQVKLSNPSNTAGITVNGDVVMVVLPPQISAVTLTSSSPALISDSITATVSAVSYSGTALRYQWYYSTNGGILWTAISGAGSAALSFQPESTGTYTFKVIVRDDFNSVDSYAAGFTDVVVKVVPIPSILGVAVSPYTLDLSLSNYVHLSSTIVNPSGVSSMVWQVNKDSCGWVDTTLTQGSGSITVIDNGTYLYRLKVIPFGGSTIYSEPTHSVIAGHLPEIHIDTEEMIITSLFLIICAAAVVLFIMGLVFVHYGHTLGFLANVLSLVMMWTMTALSAFGSVGDTVYHSLYTFNESGSGKGFTTIQEVITFIDPALVYLSLFASILCTAVFILILVRFVMDNVNGNNPEMEDESIWQR